MKWVVPMFSNSLLYRRWWYIKKRNIKNINKIIRFTLTIILLWPLLIYAWNSMFAITESLTGINPGVLLEEETERFITSAFSGLKFDGIMTQKEDEAGNVTAVHVDNAALTQVLRQMERELKKHLDEVLKKECSFLCVRAGHLSVNSSFLKNEKGNTVYQLGIAYHMTVCINGIPMLKCDEIHGLIPLVEKTYLTASF